MPCPSATLARTPLNGVPCGRHSSAPAVRRVAVPLRRVGSAGVQVVPRMPLAAGGRPSVVAASSRPGSHRPEEPRIVEASFSDSNGAAPPPSVSDPNRGTDAKSAFLWLGAAYAMAVAAVFGFFPSALWQVLCGKTAVLPEGCRAACVMIAPCLLGWASGMMSAVDAGPKATAEYCRLNAVTYLLGANIMSQMGSTVLAWCFALTSLASYVVSFTGRKEPAVPRLVTPCGWKASAFMALSGVFVLGAALALYLSPELGWQVLMGPGAAFPASTELVRLMSVPCLGWAISKSVAHKAGEEGVSSFSEINLLSISFAMYFGFVYGVKWYALIWVLLAVGFTYFGFFGDGCHSVNKIKTNKPNPEEESSFTL